MEYKGSCHCGAVRYRFESSLPLRPRECSCSFCRKHGGRSLSDSDGKVTIEGLRSAHAYRFGMNITDVWICATCGVYVAASMELDGGALAVVNMRAIEPVPDAAEPEAVHYEADSTEARIERRRRVWTPAILVRD